MRVSLWCIEARFCVAVYQYHVTHINNVLLSVSRKLVRLVAYHRGSVEYFATISSVVISTLIFFMVYALGGTRNCLDGSR